MIKRFRVWNSHHKRWEERACAVTNEGSLIIYNPDTSEWFRPLLSDYKVSWFTGLRDKDGKEGVQNDLIDHFDRNGKKPVEIIWKDGGWYGRYIGCDFTFALNGYEMSRARIIGNTHVTPC